MRLISQHICKTQDLGVSGNLFGGVMLSWLDEAGYIFACELAEENKMVTYRIAEHFFKSPVKVGDVVQIFAGLKAYGKHSVTVNMRAFTVDPQTKQSKLVTETEMTFVAIDDAGNKKTLSTVTAAHIALSDVLAMVSSDKLSAMTPVKRQEVTIEALHKLKEISITNDAPIVAETRRLLLEQLGIREDMQK